MWRRIGQFGEVSVIGWQAPPWMTGRVIWDKPADLGDVLQASEQRHDAQKSVGRKEMGSWEDADS